MCGVFGVYAPDRDVARLTYFGLFALQHRGQESAGIAVSEHGRLTGAARPRPRLAGLRRAEARRPARPGRDRPHALLDDRLVPVGERAAARPARPRPHGRARPQRQPRQRRRAAGRAARGGVALGTTSDSELIAALIANDERPARRRGRERDAAARRRLLDRRAVGGQAARASATRTASGRSSLGRIHDDWVLASETCALDLVGAEFVREVAPGELVVRRRGGLAVDAGSRAGRRRRALHLRVLLPRAPRHAARRDRGARRARADGRAARAEAPAEADLVLPIPDSGTPAAIGFARATGLPFSEGLIKNRYVQPHLHPARPGAAPAGHPAQVQPARRGGRQARRRRRRLDRPRQHDARDRADALRRGRGRGAPADLVAAGDRPVLLRHRPRRPGGADRRGRTVDEIASYIGATSLAYLSHDGLVEATSRPASALCRACLTGEYPTEVPVEAAKLRFEPARARGAAGGGARDENVVGVVHSGSRGRNAYVTERATGTRSSSSARNAATTVRRGATVEVSEVTLEVLADPPDWARPPFELAPQLDKTGEVAAALQERSRRPRGCREPLDAYVNSYYRSAKNARIGLELASLLDAQESIPWFLEFVFAVHGRLRPFNKWLGGSWRSIRLPGATFRGSSGSRARATRRATGALPRRGVARPRAQSRLSDRQLGTGRRLAPRRRALAGSAADGRGRAPVRNSLAFVTDDAGTPVPSAASRHTLVFGPGPSR